MSILRSRSVVKVAPLSMSLIDQKAITNHRQYALEQFVLATLLPVTMARTGVLVGDRAVSIRVHPLTTSSSMPTALLEARMRSVGDPYSRIGPSLLPLGR